MICYAIYAIIIIYFFQGNLKLIVFTNIFQNGIKANRFLYKYHTITVHFINANYLPVFTLE